MYFDNLVAPHDVVPHAGTTVEVTEGGRMGDGYLALLPIQGAVVAVVLLVVSIVKVVRGITGTESLTWNTVGIVCLLYLFTGATWYALGQPTGD